jgi:hypothetical protein
MNNPHIKSARTWLLNAKEKQDIAQADYDSEVQLFKECERELLQAFNDKVSTERFLEIREMKKIQGRIMREAHQRLSLAMHVVDLAETEYDMAFSRAALASDPSAVRADGGVRREESTSH